MSYAPILTQGTTLSFNSAAVGGIVSIKGIGSGKATEIPTTTLASTAKEFKQGLQDFGNVSINVIRSLDDVGQAAMLTAQAAQATEVCVVTLPAGTLKIATFNAFVETMPSDIDKDGVVTGDIMLRITGAVVWTSV